MLLSSRGHVHSLTKSSLLSVVQVDEMTGTRRGFSSSELDRRREPRVRRDSVLLPPLGVGSGGVQAYPKSLLGQFTRVGDRIADVVLFHMGSLVDA